MPSGKVHDQITMLTAALSVPAWWALSPAHDALVFGSGVAAYLFGGFWLSDDLDTNSVSYKRWGVLKFLWWPYQKLVPHRSWVSHGVGVGPLLRVIYFLFMLWAVAASCLWLVNKYVMTVDRNGILRHAGISLYGFVVAHPALTGAIVVGLVLSGLAHSLADTIVSFFKRVW